MRKKKVDLGDKIPPNGDNGKSLFETPDDGLQLLVAEEVAVILRVSPATVYEWAYQRRIPCVRLGSRTVRFRPDDIRKLLAQSL